MHMSELFESFAVLAKQIEKVIKSSETAVFKMGQAAENSMAMIKNSKDLIANSLQEVLVLNQESIAAINEVVEENAKVLERVETYLSQLMEKIAGVFGGWGKEEQAMLVEILENVNRKTRVVALNASIEAARLGTVGRSFAVVAQEIQNLVGKTSEAIGNLAEHNQIFAKKAEELSGNLEQLENFFLKQLRAANNKLTQSGDISQRWGEKTSEIFAKINQSLEQLEEDITQEAVSFQFQDIISQRLNHVIQGLKLIEEHLKNNDQEDLLNKITALYTSEEERKIHHNILNNSEGNSDESINNIEFF